MSGRPWQAPEHNVRPCSSYRACTPLWVLGHPRAVDLVLNLPISQMRRPRLRGEVKLKCPPGNCRPHTLPLLP